MPQPDLVNAMNFLQQDKEYTSGDVSLYRSDVRANTLMEQFAEAKW